MIKTALLTGATGFLGQEILHAAPVGCEVTSLGKSNRNSIVVDLSKQVPSFQSSFDLVIHNAGLAHVIPKNDEEARAFHQVNVIGTENLLKGLDSIEKLPRQFIFISSVSVYGLDEGEMITEEAPLKGNTPYAKSKVLAEQKVFNWCSANKVHCIALRLPLVVGNNAPGNLGSLSAAIKSGKYFSINNNPSRKSVVKATDVANLIYLINKKDGVFNLTDGVHPSFNQIENTIAAECGKKISITLPLWVVSIAAKLGNFLNAIHLPFPLNTNRLNKMTTSLTFNDNKARKLLDWNPAPAFSIN